MSDRSIFRHNWICFIKDQWSSSKINDFPFVIFTNEKGDAGLFQSAQRETLSISEGRCKPQFAGCAGAEAFSFDVAVFWELPRSIWIVNSERESHQGITEIWQAATSWDYCGCSLRVGECLEDVFFFPPGGARCLLSFVGEIKRRVRYETFFLTKQAKMLTAKCHATGGFPFSSTPTCVCHRSSGGTMKFYNDDILIK